MKLIIIEGLDNTGKTTVIKGLSNYYRTHKYRVTTLHCEGPDKSIPQNELDAYMDGQYTMLAKSLISDNEYDECDVTILDRCWYSECVYGPIYRNRNINNAHRFVNKIEKELIKNIGITNIILVVLNVDNTEFCIKHEDGLSLSENDIEKINTEQDLFKRVFETSLLKYKIDITVNSGMSFKPKQSILDQILDVINDSDAYANSEEYRM